VLLPYKSQGVSSTEFEGFVPSGCNIVGGGLGAFIPPAWCQAWWLVSWDEVLVVM